MTLWETQEAEEAARNAEWEALNAEEPEDQADLYSAKCDLHLALDYVERGIRWIDSTADYADGSPFADEITTALEALREQFFNLQEIEKRIKQELIRREERRA